MDSVDQAFKNIDEGDGNADSGTGVAVQRAEVEAPGQTRKHKKRGPKKKMRRNLKYIEEQYRYNKLRRKTDPRRLDWQPCELTAQMHIPELKRAYEVLLARAKKFNPKMTLGQAKTYMSGIHDPVGQAVSLELSVF